MRGYIEAVVWQLTHASGATPPDNATAAEDTAVTRVLGLVEAAPGGGIAFEGAVEMLAQDPVLLSAFFQNLDLLPAEDDPQVNAIASMVGGAVHRLSETLDRQR